MLLVGGKQRGKLLLDEQRDLARVAGAGDHGRLLVEQVVVGRLDDLHRLVLAIGQGLGRLPPGVRLQGDVGDVLELAQLDGDLLHTAFAFAFGAGDGAVRLQPVLLHLRLTGAAQHLQLLLRGDDLLVGAVLGHRLAPVRVRLGALGLRLQARLLDLHLLALARQRLVGQVGDVVRGVPYLLQRHRHHAHAEGAQVLVAVAQQFGAELGALAFHVVVRIDVVAGQTAALAGAVALLHALHHADRLQRRGLVERAAEVAHHGLLDLLLDLGARLAHEAFHGGVEQGVVLVVHAHAGGGVGADRDAVRRVHSLHAHVDGNGAQPQPLHALEEGDDERPPAALQAKAVALAANGGLGAGHHQHLVGRAHPDHRAQHADDEHERGHCRHAAADKSFYHGSSLRT